MVSNCKYCNYKLIYIVYYHKQVINNGLGQLVFKSGGESENKLNKCKKKKKKKKCQSQFPKTQVDVIKQLVFSKNIQCTMI